MIQYIYNQFDIDHWIAHFASAVAILAALFGYMPYIAAFVGMVWYLVQIYESKTFQNILKKDKKRKKR